MNRLPQKHRRILSVAPSTRGFGFAVLEGQTTLVDWGVKSVKEDKNAQSLAKVKDLITQYRPGLIVLEDCSAKHSRRAPRIQALIEKVITLARSLKVGVVLFSRERVRRRFFADGKGTKHALAEIVADQFPEELRSRLPPKRRLWMSEDYRMGIFDAVALALAVRERKLKGTA